MRLFLIGFMGAGKSTIGKLLAKELQLSFTDLDEFIEKKEALPVPLLFQDRGEEAFRLLESAALGQWINDNQSGVLACGGGTPCFLGNSRKMKISGTLIYLEVHDSELFDRLKNQTENRPLLKGKNADELREEITQKLHSRKPFYEQADFKIDASNAPEQVVQDVLIALKANSKA